MMQDLSVVVQRQRNRRARALPLPRCTALEVLASHFCICKFLALIDQAQPFGLKRLPGRSSRRIVEELTLAFGPR